MRTLTRTERDKPLPSHFIIYDYDAPSPAFTREQVESIESIRRDFNADDLARIQKIETWVLNTNTGFLNSPAIPGLRPKPTNGHRYFRRFSADRMDKMLETFLTYIPKDFPPRGSGCNMPVVRVTIPGGDKFYPIVFHGDLEKWVERLDSAAAFFQTQLGQFDRGRFVVSDGIVYPFASIEIDKPEVIPPPKDW